MRAAASVATVLLVACSQQAPAPDPDSLIACALAGAETFVRDCSFEAMREADGLVLTVRHPDGGFRRLTVAPDGGIAPADGAERAAVSAYDGGHEVTVGADRYRIPALVADVDGQ